MFSVEVNMWRWGVGRFILVHFNKAIKDYSGDQEGFCCHIATEQSFFVMELAIPET